MKSSIKTPMFYYHGSKFSVRRKIVKWFPNHNDYDTYVEPFCGSAAVLLAKPRSKFELINDLYGRVINFITQLRDNPQDLIGALELTLYSRKEYEKSRAPSADSLEDARRFYVACEMSIAHIPHKNSGFAIAKNASSKRTTHAKVFSNHVKGLYDIAQRLQGVYVESKDALDILVRHDSERTLHFVDPPYLLETRTSSTRYYSEAMDDMYWHMVLASVCHSLKGYVILCGYHSELYDELYTKHGWRRVEYSARTNSNKSAGKRVEVLWLSPNLAEYHESREIDKPVQLPLYGKAYDECYI